MASETQRDDQAGFWDEKARTFPRYEPGEHTYEAGVLARIAAHGVDFRGKTVLDVGSGSGMYTLRIAQLARRVTAVDISERMLRILRQDAAALGLDNIEYVHSSWEQYHGDGVFDVVFCSMTPAIRSEASREKLLRYSGGLTVFMGYAGVMSSDMLQGLLARYGIAPRVFNDGPDMRAWLDGKGVAYAAIPIEGRWTQRRGKEETIASLSAMLLPYQAAPDRAFLEEYAAGFQEGPDAYVERTDYKIELIIWKK